jgi:hypothetical protein
MYVCYVDESGHCGKKYNADQPVEVLCGVLTDVSKLFKTQREHSEILQILNEREIPLEELKANEAYRGRKSWADVPPEVRDRVFELVLQWAHERSCKYVVCPIDSKKFFDQKKTGCDVSKSLCHPYETGAMNIVLAIERLHKSKKNNKGKTLIIFDEQNNHDKNILTILEDDLSFTDPYTGYKEKPRAKNQVQRLNQIIDVPHFSKSHLSVMIQIADWVAFVVNKYLLLTCYGEKEKYDGELDKITRWYETIGECKVTHTAIDPPGNDFICSFFRDLRPDNWTAKDWIIT